jgi:Flp pilus assembly pilin Flp
MDLLLAQWISRINKHLAEQGQDLTEYAFLVALIAIIVAAAILFFGTEVSTFYSILGSSVASWIS